MLMVHDLKTNYKEKMLKKYTILSKSSISTQNLTRLYLVNSLIIIFFLLTFCLQNSLAHEKSFFSPAEMKLIKKAISLADEKKWQQALEITEKIPDSTAQQSILWMKFTDGENLKDDLSEIKNFFLKHQSWPDSHLMRNKIELMIQREFRHDHGKSKQIDAVISWFNKFPPKTAEGERTFAEAKILKISNLGHASLTAAQKDQIKKMIQHTWINGNFDIHEQRVFLAKYQKYLTHANHVARINNLLWQKKTTQAKELFSSISKPWQSVFRARLAMIEKKISISKEFNAIPKNLRNDPNLIHDRVAWNYSQENFDKALELMQHVKHAMPKQAQWWKLKKSIIRDLIEKQKFKQAYHLAFHHHNTKPEDKAEAQWLCGWLSLRFLHDSKKAYTHFYHLYETVKLPISKSRAAYWSGRAAEDDHNKEVSLKWYNVAAMHPDTFYGQLAQMKTSGHDRVRLAAAPKITTQDFDAYSKNKMLKIAYIFSEVEKYSFARKFVHQAVSDAKTKGQIELITRFGTKIGKLNLSVEASKKASWKYGELTENGYPVIKNFSQFNANGLEEPLAHAIIRQESLFDTNALSPAGAMGLMQLMPQTAKVTAQQMNLRYSLEKLKKSPAMNLKIGSFYLKQLVDEWNGSYILAIASYNAGPHNVKKWIKKFGDPRKKHNVESVIDWMELIPFYETRNYVQRVMENLQVYRSIMKQDKIGTILINQDLTLRGQIK